MNGQIYAGDSGKGMGIGQYRTEAVPGPARRPLVDALLEGITQKVGTLHDELSKLEVRLGPVLNRKVEEPKNPRAENAIDSGPEMVRRLQELGWSLVGLEERLRDVMGRLEV